MTCSETAEAARPADLDSLRCLTVAEVAPLLKMSKPAVYRAIRSGELPAIHIGRRALVPEAALRRLIEGVT